MYWKYIFNPIYKSGGKITPDNNPKCNCPCPDDSKKRYTFHLWPKKPLNPNSDREGNFLTNPIFSEWKSLVIKAWNNDSNDVLHLSISHLYGTLNPNSDREGNFWS